MPPDGEAHAAKQFRRDYTQYFDSAGAFEEYARFRRVAEHGDRVVLALAPYCRELALRKNRVSLLDIGAGDGRVTAAAARNTRDFGAMVDVTVVEPSQVFAEQATLALTQTKPSFLQMPFRDALPRLIGRELDIVLAIESLFGMSDDLILFLPDLLSVKGTLHVWMSTRKGNILSEVCHSLGQVSRLYAEDVSDLLRDRPIDQYDLHTDYHEYKIPPLLDRSGNLNSNGLAVTRFLSLGKPDDATLVAAKQAISSYSRRFNDYNEGHTVTDAHVIIRRIR